MKIKQNIIAALIICGGHSCMGQVVAPEVVVSAGDNFSNAEGSISWTLGEPITATENSSNYYLTQGFQQPPKILVTALNNPIGVTGFSVYPNPFTGSVFIKRDGNKQLQLQLMDIYGKELLNKELSPNENQLDLSMLSTGTYLLKVTNMESQVLQSLKIEKVN